MHTFTPNDRIRIHHNGGFDGDIIICDKETGQEVRVDSDDLLAFVASRYVADRIEGWLENAETVALFAATPLMPTLSAHRMLSLKPPETLRSVWSLGIKTVYENRSTLCGANR